MVKHTQTIRRLLPTNCLSVFDHFLGLALKGLRNVNFCVDLGKCTRGLSKIKDKKIDVKTKTIASAYFSLYIFIKGKQLCH